MHFFPWIAHATRIRIVYFPMHYVATKLKIEPFDILFHMKNLNNKTIEFQWNV